MDSEYSPLGTRHKFNSYWRYILERETHTDPDKQTDRATHTEKQRERKRLSSVFTFPTSY